MRIWHQSMNELDRFPVYRDALQAHVERIVDPGTEVVLHGLAPGTYGSANPAEVLVHPELFHRVLGQLPELCRQAEEEGYDAVAIGSYTEPLLRECRSAVDIPVASMAEATLLTGCSVARRSGLITISPEVAWMVRLLVEGQALQQRVAGVWTVSPALTETQLAQAFAAPGPVLESVTVAARTAVAAGADVLVPAEGVINELLVAEGVRDLEGVPVMDAVGVVVLYAEFLARLRASTGLQVGRRWHHARPSPRLLTELATPRPATGASAPPVG